MPTPFDRFGYTDAAQTVGFANTRGAIVGLTMTPILGGGKADSSPRRVEWNNAINLIRAMLVGDMWLDGIGWIGPRPGPTEEGYHETMALLQQGFISSNILADVLDRHVAGVIGNEPQWGLALRRALKKEDQPSDAEQTLIDEAEAFLVEWWDARKVHSLFQKAVRTLLFARRSAFRLYVPRGKLVAANVVGADGRARTVKIVPTPEGDSAGGLAVVWPDHPIPEESTVAEDPDTKESLGVVLFTQGQNVQGTGAPMQVAELTYLTDRVDSNKRPMTLIRRTTGGGGGPRLAVKKGASSAVAAENAAAGGIADPNAPTVDSMVAFLRLGGRLPMYEMKREPFVTAQMIQLQRALNLALSALPRNVITSGWLERVIANAQMPGKFVTDTTKPNGKRWVPDRHTTGGGATTYLKGLRQENAGEGTTTYATPTVNFRDPSPVAPTVEAQEALYRAMLREAKQEHVLMSQDVKASGKSREQARADFEMTLRPTAAEVNSCGRWLIETALAMAEEFANTPGKYTSELRATFTCQLDTGPITDVERTAIDGSYKAGTVSLETAMSLENLADPAAEIARINAQPGAALGIVERQLAAVSAAAQAGLDIEGAAIAVGMSPADAKKLVPQFDPNAPQLDENGDPIPDPGADGPPTPKNEPEPTPTPAPKPVKK